MAIVRHQYLMRDVWEVNVTRAVKPWQSPMVTSRKQSSVWLGCWWLILIWFDLIWHGVLLCSPDWPWTYWLPASASEVLRFQASATYRHYSYDSVNPIFYPLSKCALFPVIDRWWIFQAEKRRGSHRYLTPSDIWEWQWDGKGGSKMLGDKH